MKRVTAFLHFHFIDKAFSLWYIIGVQKISKKIKILIIGGKTMKTYLASPQLGPISISHLLGTSNGTAVSMMLATLSASSFPETDIAISS
mgnify:CR=1 FL=1